MSTPDDAPMRLPWPPIVLALLLLAGGLLTWAVPLAFLPDAAFWVWPLVGVVVGACGLAIAFAATAEFRRAQTTVLVTRASTAVVDTGVFRYSRNPIYVGMTLLLLGIGIGLNSLWLTLAAPVFAVAVWKLAVEREEAYLERRFGGEYLAYKRQVPRWFGRPARHH